MKTKKPNCFYFLALMVAVFATFGAAGTSLTGLDPDNDGTHHYAESAEVRVEFDDAGAIKYSDVNAVLWQVWSADSSSVISLSTDADGSDGWSISRDELETLGDVNSANLQAMLVIREGANQQTIGVEKSSMMSFSTQPDPTNTDPTDTPDPTPDPDPTTDTDNDTDTDADTPVGPMPEIMLVVAKGDQSSSGIIYANLIGFDEVGGASEYIFPIDSVQFTWDEQTAIELAQVRSELMQARADINELSNIVAELKTALESVGTPTPDPGPSVDPVWSVNPNTATKAELDRLPNIGPALAERIMLDRETNGLYTQPSDMTRVRGISAAMVVEFAGMLTFEAPDAP